MSHPHPPLPPELTPLDDLLVELDKRGTVPLARYRVEFNANPGKSGVGLDRTYAVKPLVMMDKQAMFAEIALLGMFMRVGWAGVWVDVAHRKFFDKMPNQSKGASLEPYLNQALARIASNNAQGRSGCWDLILWANRTVVFVQLTGAHEEIRRPHIAWLGAAMKSGFTPAQFMVVEWDYRNVVVRRRKTRTVEGRGEATFLPSP